jgi:mRNA interferase RelE/StbE
MRDRIASANNPRALGSALHGDILGSYWKYRVGDYRIVVDILDHNTTVLVLIVGNRRNIYR